MCHIGNDAARLALVAEARVAAKAILGSCFRVPVHKAMDLRDPRGFDRAVAQLATQLRSKASGPEDAAVRAAVSALDVDWPRTTAEQRRALISGALRAAGREIAAVPGAVRVTFGGAADQVVRAGREAARKTQRLTIGADFNALDRRIVSYLRASQSVFVRGEYGRRAEAFTAEAKRIVSDGLEAGLGRQDIGRDLARAASGTLGGQAGPYWEVVAGSFIGQGRSFAQLSAFAEAGLERYRFEAVLDEHTTETCRFLHGQVFTVSTGLQRFEEVEAEPDRMKDILPWVRESFDRETGRKSLYVDQAGLRTVIAEVTRSAVGTRDDRGEFSRGLSDRDLADLGVSFPPLHGLCRSSVRGACRKRFLDFPSS
ncbi:MAG: hypothetical protein RBU30_21145, partial [Polyangia bacterium]|nr:hypothetical protein [Polyangia bacterium]